jgi:hypothetical protein
MYSAVTLILLGFGSHADRNPLQLRLDVAVGRSWRVTMSNTSNKGVWVDVDYLPDVSLFWEFRDRKGKLIDFRKPPIPSLPEADPESIQWLAAHHSIIRDFSWDEWFEGAESKNSKLRMRAFYDPSYFDKVATRNRKPLLRGRVYSNWVEVKWAPPRPSSSKRASSAVRSEELQGDSENV